MLIFVLSKVKCWEWIDLVSRTLGIFLFFILSWKNSIFCWIFIVFPLISKNVYGWFDSYNWGSGFFFAHEHRTAPSIQNPIRFRWIKAENSESGLKSFCPKDLGVSGKIVGACGKNFFRNPKRFFCVGGAVLHLQT